MSSLFPALPVFMDLVGRAVVIVSGDRHAARLARDCLQAGAGVTIVHPTPGPEVRALAGVRLVERACRASDFRHAALVAAGCDERRMSRARTSAKAAKAIFMALDNGPGADVALGETAAIGPLTIGFAGTGLPQPILAAKKARLDAAAPPALGGFLEAAAHGADFAGVGAGATARWASAMEAALAMLRRGDPPPADWRAWTKAFFADAASAQK